MLILLGILYLFDYIGFLLFERPLPAFPFCKEWEKEPHPLKREGAFGALLDIYLIKQPKICISDRLRGDATVVGSGAV